MPAPPRIMGTLLQIVLRIGNTMDSVDFITLDRPKFRALRHSCTEKFHFETESLKEAFRMEYYAVLESVERAVGKKWEKEVDFEFLYDYDFYYYLAAGVYTQKALCRSFIETLANSITRFNKEHVWAIELSIEIRDNSPFGDNSGHLLIRDRICYVESHHLVRPLEF